jgi:hypothetical protein
MIDDKAYRALQHILAGQNIVLLQSVSAGNEEYPNGLENRSVPAASLRTLSGQSVGHQVLDQQTAVLPEGYRGGGRCLVKVDRLPEQDLTPLSDVALLLFAQKRAALLALSYERIARSAREGLAADELLTAIGLSGPKAYAAEMAGLAPLGKNSVPDCEKYSGLPEMVNPTVTERVRDRVRERSAVTAALRCMVSGQRPENPSGVDDSVQPSSVQLSSAQSNSTENT